MLAHLLLEMKDPNRVFGGCEFGTFREHYMIPIFDNWVYYSNKEEYIVCSRLRIEQQMIFSD